MAEMKSQLGVGDDSEGEQRQGRKEGWYKGVRKRLGFQYGAVTLRDRRISDKIVAEEGWNWEMERGKEEG